VPELKLYFPHDAELAEWYVKIRAYRYGFEDQETAETFARDVSLGALVKTEGGIYYLTGIHEHPGNAFGHCFFWDKRTRERVEELRSMTEFGLRAFELHRITVILPAANRVTCKWIERAGYTFEGRLRAYLWYGGTVYDAYIFAYYSYYSCAVRGLFTSSREQAGYVKTTSPTPKP